MGEVGHERPGQRSISQRTTPTLSTEGSQETVMFVSPIASAARLVGDIGRGVSPLAEKFATTVQSTVTALVVYIVPKVASASTSDTRSVTGIRE